MGTKLHEMEIHNCWKIFCEGKPNWLLKVIWESSILIFSLLNAKKSFILIFS
jgi:hypothetical protein